MIKTSLFAKASKELLSNRSASSIDLFEHVGLAIHAPLQCLYITGKRWTMPRVFSLDGQGEGEATELFGWKPYFNVRTRSHIHVLRFGGAQSRANPPPLEGCAVSALRKRLYVCAPSIRAVIVFALDGECKKAFDWSGDDAVPTRFTPRFICVDDASSLLFVSDGKCVLSATLRDGKLVTFFCHEKCRGSLAGAHITNEIPLSWTIGARFRPVDSEPYLAIAGLSVVPEWGLFLCATSSCVIALADPNKSSLRPAVSSSERNVFE